MIKKEFWSGDNRIGNSLVRGKAWGAFLRESQFRYWKKQDNPNDSYLKTEKMVGTGVLWKPNALILGRV